MALVGNKGSWSEVYVFLKLLADGKLYAADNKLNKIHEIYYPIVKILRQEVLITKEYIIDRDILVYDAKTSSLLLKIPVSEFVNISKELLKNLKNISGRSFSFPTIETFLDSIHVRKLTATSKNKADIRVVVHDQNTGLKPELGFSIKSMLGKDSTLFNPGAGTNFIYKVEGPYASIDIFKFNTDTLNQSKISHQKSKIALRLNELERLGYKITFDSIQSENLQLNLELIDSQLPEILAYILYYKFKYGVSKTTELISVLNSDNPIPYNLSKGHPFYELKIKSFLVESAVGMTPETVWTGVYDATGGVIIVKETGDLVCYHIYNKNEFQDYLVNHTKLEQASTSEDDHNPGFAKEGKTKPYKYGWLYEEDGELYIKLNLQIRFI